ncbi:MAG: hypothetical protein ACPG49_13095 [Chitinophagales bacterium]
MNQKSNRRDFFNSLQNLQAIKAANLHISLVLIIISSFAAILGL